MRVRWPPSLCNVKCNEKDETNGAEPAADDHIARGGPVDCHFCMALRHGNCHQAIITMRQRRKDGVCLKCEQATVDTHLPCCVFTQVQDKETGTRDVSDD